MASKVCWWLCVALCIHLSLAREVFQLNMLGDDPGAAAAVRGGGSAAVAQDEAATAAAPKVVAAKATAEIKVAPAVADIKAADKVSAAPKVVAAKATAEIKVAPAVADIKAADKVPVAAAAPPKPKVNPCGNGVKEKDEECDDGNSLSDDGCSSKCEVEAGWECTGGNQTKCKKAICGDGTRSREEECDDFNDDSGDGCSEKCKVERGFECRYDAQSKRSNCTATCGDGIKIKGYEQCDDGNLESEDGCSRRCTVEPGYVCSGGSMFDRDRCRPTRCGDGKKEGLEKCDDGNRNDNDGCSAKCEVERGWKCALKSGGAQKRALLFVMNPKKKSVCETICGDGVVVGNEECDDGGGANKSSSKCRNCKHVSVCGNGKVEGKETCDDHNEQNGDGCDAKCEEEPGYYCKKQGNGTSACKTRCGDGVPAGPETCDDGNKVGNDGCRSNCTIEPGFTCTSQKEEAELRQAVRLAEEKLQKSSSNSTNGTSSPKEKKKKDNSPKSICRSSCGDGIKVPIMEECDDGNLEDNDGCSKKCKLEEGWKCRQGPTGADRCKAKCGDGLKRGKEECDDGNLKNDDGCSSKCSVENGWKCTNSSSIKREEMLVGLLGASDDAVSRKAFSVCKSKCGDGRRVGTEECDDGGTKVGDGCAANCTVEPGFECEGGSKSNRDVCSSLCGNGKRTKNEACDDGNNKDGDGCSDSCKVEEGYHCAHVPDAPDKCAKKRDCIVGKFGGWSDCDAKCGGGVRKRTREVETAASNNGQECPSLKEEQKCNEQPCPENMDCEVSEYPTKWSPCSAECDGGKQHRVRRVITAARGTGKKCPDLKQERKCNTKACPAAQDCRMGQWTEYSSCSKKCGKGQQTRTREVIKKPKYNGVKCGELKQTRHCNTQGCGSTGGGKKMRNTAANPGKTKDPSEAAPPPPAAAEEAQTKEKKKATEEEEAADAEAAEEKGAASSSDQAKPRAAP